MGQAASEAVPDPASARARLLVGIAVNRLRLADPCASAAERFARWQLAGLVAGSAALAAGLLLAPRLAVGVLLVAAVVPSVAFLLLRLAALREIGRHAAPAPVLPPGLARHRPGDLPVYSVLVPLYREAEVVPQLLDALDRLDYPRSRLDILLLVEEDDRATKEAIERHPRGEHIRVAVLPDGQPRTKPRALNYGLALSRGAYVVVYDAEDQPEADQLQKALAVFSRADERLGCLQARLNIYNPDASGLTRLFTLEYSALFDGVLPVLQRWGLPIMLGGTSNHFPRAALEAVGGWDPFNVTEDADLGLRLARRGYRVGVLASTTWEEAPAEFGVWHGQRTRWLKGWMQTYLVHMRRPRRLVAELGCARFLAVNILTGAGVLSALAHPWTYLVLLIDIADAQAPASSASFFGALVWWMAAAHLVFSYGAAIVLGWMAVAARGRAALGWSGLWLPVYWMAISLAAYRAMFELVRRPHHWEKTPHHGQTPGTTASPHPLRVLETR